MKKKHASEGCIRGNVCEKKKCSRSQNRWEWPGYQAVQFEGDSAGPLRVLDPNFTMNHLAFPREKNLLGTPCCAQSKPGKLGITHMYSYFKTQHLGLEGNDTKTGPQRGTCHPHGAVAKVCWDNCKWSNFSLKRNGTVLFVNVEKSCNSFTLFSGTT